MGRGARKRALPLAEGLSAAQKLQRADKGCVIEHGQVEHAGRGDPLGGGPKRLGQESKVRVLLERHCGALDPRPFELGPD